MRNLAEMLAATVSRAPDAEAIVHRETRLTWRALERRVFALAARLQAAGLGRRDVVAIYAPHSPAQIVALFAAAFTPARFSIISPSLKENQIKFQICDCNPKAIVGTEELLAPYADFFASRHMTAISIREDGLLPEGGSEIPEMTIPFSVPADVCNIIYTSGSTGKPKGVVLPARTLLDGARIVSGYLKITDADTLLSILPYHFDYGLNQLLTTVYQGGRIVLLDFRFPKDLIDTLASEKVTGFACVPSLWPKLLDPKFYDWSERPEFPNLRYITTAGGPHSQELLRKLADAFPATEIIIMYGLTESFRSTYLPFKEIFTRPGSIGKPVPEVDILVLDDAGRHCEPDQRGELVHRGAFVSYGYLNNAELTAEKFIPLQTGGDGCLPEYGVRSGDIVSRDEEGFIYFHGRIDTQIKVSGYRLSPTEVEEAALQIEGVNQAAVFSIRNAETGEEVCLAYTTYQGAALDVREMRREMARLLPTYAVPNRIHFYETLPLTASGKVNYPALKEAVSEHAGNR